MTREVDNATTGHRHEVRARYNVTFSDQGQLLRTKFDVDVNAGMSSDLSKVWTETLVKRMDGGYTLRYNPIHSIIRVTNIHFNINIHISVMLKLLEQS